jgi:hypothetical protein
MSIVASVIRRRVLLVGLAGVLAAAVGCASAIPPVRMYGDERELGALVGRWSGDYVGDRIGTRRGSVFFELLRGEDHAHGDVTMIPEGGDQPYTRYEPGTAPVGVEQQGVRFLSIRFIEVGDGIVSGTLDPYWDPDRRTQASSTFRGRVTDNVIEGTYVTTYRNGDPEVTGRWIVRRQP